MGRGDFPHVVVFEVLSMSKQKTTDKGCGHYDGHLGWNTSQIILHTLACFPDVSSLELETIFTSSNVETGIVSQKDLADLSLLQKKTQVPDNPDLAIEVASVIDRKGLARAGSWFMTEG